MTEEQLLILRRKINTLKNYAYQNGIVDESEQNSYKQQAKYAQLSDQASDDIYDFVVICNATHKL
jgi:hypothetical protein